MTKPATLTNRTMHMVIARSLFRRLLENEKDWRSVLQNADAYPTREDALAAVDALPEELVWMPACDDHDATGRCRGHKGA